jgi:glucose-6-phosphate isomerase
MNSTWSTYQKRLLRYPQLGFSLDTSLMDLSDEWLASMEELCAQAFGEMKELESGALANPDEGRMVGHYWLRAPHLAPDEKTTHEIERDIESAKGFAAEVHDGSVTTPKGEKFTDLLVIGIGGSALGPQLVVDALNSESPPMKIHFLDNTDPDGMDRVWAGIGENLATTMVIVISKSGGTKETRNGMLETEEAFRLRGLSFPGHAVAVTQEGSQLDRHADTEEWMRKFPMTDWVGGRTSVMSTVGLVPCALVGVDIDQFLAGAKAMDELTRVPDVASNASMMLALSWYAAGDGKGKRDMVILPYKDRLLLLSKYLQQLVMESLGKELDRDGKVVHQGIAVYGNKGSTDQHAYVQQLRDGIDNFFATFIEVRQARSRASVSLETDTGATSGDYLQGFLRGTRKALYGNGRKSITISVGTVDAHVLGMLIALFERAVGFYASLVNVNAYHQPGVEAGKVAATEFLSLLVAVREAISSESEAVTAEQIAAKTGGDPEDVYHCLTHLSANHSQVEAVLKHSPATDQFRWLA